MRSHVGSKYMWFLNLCPSMLSWFSEYPDGPGLVVAVCSLPVGEVRTYAEGFEMMLEMLTQSPRPKRFLSGQPYPVYASFIVFSSCAHMEHSFIAGIIVHTCLFSDSK